MPLDGEWWLPVAPCFRGTSVAPRGRADDASKVSIELTLVTKSNLRCHIRSAHSTIEKPPRAGNTQVREILVRWHPNLGSECAAQMELVEARMQGEFVEGNAFTEFLTQIVHRQPDGPGLMRSRSFERNERCDGFSHGNLDVQAWCASIDSIVQPMERPRTNITAPEVG